jgi:integrase
VNEDWNWTLRCSGERPTIENLSTSEKWCDLDFAEQLIRVRRAYVERRFGPPKSKASKAPVPMHPLLAAHLLAWRRETLYSAAGDFVFPSLRLKGKRPPAANMLVADYLRVAATKAGVVAPPRTFGFHTFRRTLASVLVKMKVDLKTVQEIVPTENLISAKKVKEGRCGKRITRFAGP